MGRVRSLVDILHSIIQKTESQDKTQASVFKDRFSLSLLLPLISSTPVISTSVAVPTISLLTFLPSPWILFYNLLFHMGVHFNADATRIISSNSFP